MKQILDRIKPWFFPKLDKETDKEILTLNISNIHYVSLVVGIVQSIVLVLYLVTNSFDFSNKTVLTSCATVSFSVILCSAGYIISGFFRKKDDYYENNLAAAKIFIGAFFILLILWGMLVSARPYSRDEQMVTFYIVEVVVLLFVKLKPAFTTSVILSSYVIFYIALNYFIKPGNLNPYNFMMMAFISVAGALLNYRLTAKYIEQKNKANTLNESLEVIANHDSVTRLQNRYALNQNIPEYLGKEVCIAMGDIDKFKAVNDTFGHTAGDDVLKAFSDILLESFPRENIYRYGGDEFLIVEETGDLDSFTKQINNVNEKFKHIHLKNVEMNLGCSFGIVSAHPETPGEFFSQVMCADNKLYNEKSKLREKTNK